MIELFIFDQGGVLCRDFDVTVEAARRLGMEVGRFRELVAPDMHPYMRGELDDADFWRRFEGRSGIRVTENYWQSLFMPTLDAATYALVKELGLRARVVGGTNTIAAHYEIHRRLGHYDCLHKVYASQLMGLSKPDPAFWLAILEAEGASPERTFFVDDYPENVEAAAGLGIVSRLYTNAARLRRELVDLGAPLADAR
jgi:putative hydrolase of the HAD superfamily